MVLDNVSTSEEFDVFWDELADWWGAFDDEEFLAMKKGATMYTLKCGWSEGALVAAMVASWAEEWDYVQLYRGMFGWDDVGKGFYSQGLRKKVAKLLLDEMIRRNEWMQAHPDIQTLMPKEIASFLRNAQKLRMLFERSRTTSRHWKGRKAKCRRKITRMSGGRLKILLMARRENII